MAEGEFETAVLKLTAKICDVWAPGMMPGVAPPCMLAYAAAGTTIQVSSWYGAKLHAHLGAAAANTHAP